MGNGRERIISLKFRRWKMCYSDYGKYNPILYNLEIPFRVNSHRSTENVRNIHCYKSAENIRYIQC